MIAPENRGDLIEWCADNPMDAASIIEWMRESTWCGCGDSVRLEELTHGHCPNCWGSCDRCESERSGSLPATPQHWLNAGDDGAIWVITSSEQVAEMFRDTYERQCEVCDGAGWVDGIGDCLQCDGAGRHTFVVDVEVGDIPELRIPSVPGTLYAHIVPGTVLPIRSLVTRVVYPSITKSPRTHDKDTGFTLHRAPGVQQQVELPPAARVGMWAIGLVIHDR